MTGNEIKQMRQSLGLKQYEAAKIFGISSETMSRIENGHRTCPAYIITGLIAMYASESSFYAVIDYWGKI